MNALQQYIIEQIRKGQVPEDLAVEMLKKFYGNNSIETLSNSSGSDIVGCEPIAVIGMACNFPKAPDIIRFWNNLLNSVDAITEIPSSRWAKDGFYSTDAEKPNTSTSKWGGFLDGLGYFDMNFFGMTADQAESMDPQQALFLETAWHAMEDGGYAGSVQSSRNIGVFVGARASDKPNSLFKWRKTRTSGLKAEQHRNLLIGYAQNFIAARVSHCLNLNGPAVVVDTACSSSLVSIHAACQSIRNRECEMAIAGGVDILVLPEVYIALSKSKALSPDGRCKTFDANANGYVPGEGAGAVLLKPLSQAIRDNDRIYGVIRGSAVNNDGYTMGITTPNLEAQKSVISKAYKLAGISPDTVSYIEAHGTGTQIGDPIEIKALAEVFKEYTSRTGFCAIGSVKTNIGHLHSAAGVASFIKVMLSLWHKKLPSTLHCKNINPRIGFSNTPFYPNTSMKNWAAGDEPLRAGISSFGFGGTNCHMLVEEAPQNQSDSVADQKGYEMLMLSAANSEALRGRAADLYKILSGNSDWNAADVCGVMNKDGAFFKNRTACLVSSPEDILISLKSLSGSGGEREKGLPLVMQGEIPASKKPKVAFLFPGQGAQYRNMGCQLYGRIPVFREYIDKCDAYMKPYLKMPLREIMMSETVDDRVLKNTVLTQPAIFAIEYALAKTWIELGVMPDALIGHSIGEYAAACLSGALELKDACKLVALRGKLMQENCKTGKMIAIYGPIGHIEDQIKSCGRKVTLAAYNAYDQAVVAGEEEAIDEFLLKLCSNNEQKVLVQELNLSHASHCPLVEPMLDEYSKVLGEIEYKTPNTLVISNITGKPAELINAAYLLEHIQSPVRFAEGIDWLYKAGYEMFLEVGPGQALSELCKEILGKKDRMIMYSIRQEADEVRTMLMAAGQMYVNGADIKLKNFFNNRIKSRLMYMPYAFERIKCWDYSFVNEAMGSVCEYYDNKANNPDYTYIDKCIEKTGDRAVFHKRYSTADVIMRDHTVMGKFIIPGVSWLEMTAAAFKSLGKSLKSFKKVSFLEPFQCIDGKETTAELVISWDDSTAYFAGYSILEGVKTECMKGEVQLGGHQGMPRIDLSAIRNRCPYKMEADDLYQSLRSSGIVHGAYYKSFIEAFTSNEEAIAKLELSNKALESARYVSIHPALIDAATTVGNSLPKYARLIKEGKPLTYIPFFIKEINVYGDLPEKCCCYFKSISESQQIITYDIAICDELGQVLLELKSFSCKSIPESARFLQTGNFHTDKLMQPKSGHFNTEGMFYKTTWVKADSSKPDRQKIKDNDILLLFMDETGIGVHVKKQFRQHDGNVISVIPGTRFQEMAYGYSLNPEESGDYVKLVDRLRDRNLIPNKVLHLWNCRVGDEISAFNEIEKNQFLGFFSITFLTQALLSKGSIEGIDMLLGAAQTQCLENETGPLALDAAMLAGLVNSLKYELPKINIKMIDFNLEASTIKETAEILISELYSSYMDRISAYRNNERWIREIVDLNFEKAEELQLKNGGTYLITGGSGGIGLEIAEYLSRAACVNLALISRSGLIPQDQWEKHISEHCGNNDLSARIKRLKAIMDGGSRVLVIKADVAEESELNHALNIIHTEFGRISGVVHAAGVNKDLLLRSKSKDQICEVLRAKVKGTLTLGCALENESLDFFVLCSSVASVYGGLGQSDYCAANAFLDAYASYRSTVLNKKTLSINWSMWEGVGMSNDPELIRYFEKATGLRALEPAEAVEAFGKALTLPLSQVLVEKGRRVINTGSSSSSIVESRAGTVVGASSKTVSEYEAVKEITAYVISKISYLEGIEPADINVDEEFLSIGIDSAGIVELANSLADDFGISLYPTMLFEYTTIRELVQYLYQNYTAEMQKYIEAFRSRELTSGEAAGCKPSAIYNVEQMHKADLCEEAVSSIHPEEDRIPAFKEDKSFRNNGMPQTDIAVIGYQARFPGSESNEAYWETLSSGKFTVTEVGSDRWETMQYYHPDPTMEGKSISKWAGLLNGIDEFDPYFFKISPREAREMDPQQRLFMEAVWQLLEMSGYAGNRIQGSRTGVFVGVMNQDYQFEAAKCRRYLGVGAGVSPAILANRVSYFLNLKGPSMPVETACSSSLVAVHIACESILRGESEMAIAGGVNILLSPEPFVEFSKFGMLSPEGKCKTFDSSADGYVRSEGVGAVLLKPLSAALRDKDRIYAVIKGSAINHNGHTNGISAPNPKAQMEVIIEAYKKSHIDPSTVSYIEVHGTGTPLGDPVEVQALTQAFREFTEKQNFCALGSVKTNIGHTESASGVAGLIKVIMMMNNKVLVPSLHYKNLNPLIKLDNSPFYLPTSIKEWEVESNLLRAGISSFGFGGVNCHMLLEEAPAGNAGENKDKKTANIFQLTAKTKGALYKLICDMQDAIGKQNGLKTEDICFTLNTGRGRYPHRFAADIEDIDDLAARLSELKAIDDLDISESYYVYDRQHMPAVIFDFEAVEHDVYGIRELYKEITDFSEFVTECVKALESSNNSEYASEVIQWFGSGSEKSHIPEIIKLITELAIAKVWVGFGVVPYKVKGTRNSKVIAAYFSGVISLKRIFELAPGGDILECASFVEAADNGMEYIKAGDEPSDSVILSMGIRRNAWTGLMEHMLHLMRNGIEISWDKFYEKRTVRRTALPAYPFEREHYWFDDIKCGNDMQVVKYSNKELQDISIANTAKDNIQDEIDRQLIRYKGWLHHIVWKQVDLNLEAKRELKEGTWILLSDGNPASDFVVRRLEEWGSKCVKIDTDDAGGLEKTLRNIRKSGKSLAGIVYFCAYFRRNGRSEGQEEAAGQINKGVLGLQSLICTLRKNRLDNDYELWVISNNSRGTGEAEEKISPEKSMIWGLSKVISQENANIRIRGLEFDERTSDEAAVAERIVEEICSSSDEFLVAYRNERRLVPELEQIDVTSLRAEKRFCTEKKTYWITGGLGDLGIEVAGYIAKHGKATVVLTGRNNYLSREAWDNREKRQMSDDSVAIKIDKIKKIEESGSEVCILPGDVSDLGQTKKIVREIKERYGAIHGVFHLAGAESAGILAHKHTGDTFKKAFESKVFGTKAISQALEVEKLECFVLFSSMSPIFGGIGLSDYSAANCYLDSYAYNVFHSEGANILSINWPLWSEIGMGTRNSYFRDKKLPFNQISKEDGMNLLDIALKLRRPNIIIGKKAQEPILDARLEKEQKKEAADTNTYSDAAVMKTEKELIKIFAAVLHTEEDKIDIKTEFEEYGINSRMRLEILDKVETKYNIDLPLSTMTDYRTILQMAEYLKVNYFSNN